MGRKNILYSFAMLSDADASTSQTSEIVKVATLDQASIRLSWTGTPVGVASVEAQNGDNEPWYELDFGAPLTVDAIETNHQIVFNSMPFTAIRLQYASTSGAGTIDAVISAKVVGA